VPIHAPPIPAGSSSSRATNGSRKIIAIAQTITVVIAIDACSLRVPTAPEIAIAADTPQTAPPTPRVAAKRCSRPSRRATR